MITNNPCVGGVVIALQGRDKDRYYMITKLEGNGYVRIADGNLRRLANPKLKNLKHLRVIDRVLDDIEAKLKSKAEVNDAELRKALKQISEPKLGQGG